MNWELIIGILALATSIFSIVFTLLRTRKVDKDVISDRYEKLLSRLFIYRNKIQHSVNRLEIILNADKKEVQEDIQFLNKITDTISIFNEWWDDLDKKIKDLMKNYPDISIEELNKAATSTDVAVDLIEIAIKQVGEFEEIFSEKN